MLSWIRQNFGYPPLLLLFTAGVFLRVILMVAYFPALLLFADSPAICAHRFDANVRRLLDACRISDVVATPARNFSSTLVYHRRAARDGTERRPDDLFGHASFRRKGWVACLPAAVAFLSGDHLYLEHIVMADWFLIFLTAAGLAAAVRGLVPGLNLWWISWASALLATATSLGASAWFITYLRGLRVGLGSKIPWSARNCNYGGDFAGLWECSVFTLERLR